MTEPDWIAFERLARVRPRDEDDDRFGLERDPEEPESSPAGIAWEQAADTDELTSFLCHPISRGTDEVCYLGYYSSYFDGSHSTFVRLFEDAVALAPFRTQKLGLDGLARGVFENFLDFGLRANDDEPAHALLSYYLHGADLGALRDAGTSLSWPTACFLYAAATAPLRALHAIGRVHGNLTARRVRLTLDREHNATWVEYALPIRYVAQHGRDGTPEEMRGELAVVAAAILRLARHPDPAIDRLLREDEGTPDVLRDYILGRHQPVDALLAERFELTGELPIVGWQADPVIDFELVELWKAVTLMDPMLTAADEQEQDEDDDEDADDDD